VIFDMFWHDIGNRACATQIKHKNGRALFSTRGEIRLCSQGTILVPLRQSYKMQIINKTIKISSIYWPHLGLKLKNPLDFSTSCDQHLPGSFLPSPRGNTLGTRLKPSYYWLITHIKMLSKIVALTYVYSEPSTDKLFLLCYVTLHKSVYTAGSPLYIFSKLPAI
jgi:hypothetical protein